MLFRSHSWLRKHNPEIDWVTGEVKMSRCPPHCCSGCRDKAPVERIARKAEIRWTEAVSDGPAPELHTDKALAPSRRSILEYLKEFDSVFSKESFDVLPESKKWDHAVELIPREKASNCKVYPLAPTEQKELDQFLKENLETG